MNQKTVDELKAVRERIAARAGELQSEIPKREAEIIAATKALDDTFRAELRGEGTQADIEAARKRIDDAQKALADCKRMAFMAQDEGNQVAIRLMTAERQLREAKIARVEAIEKEVREKIQADKKLRATLVELYGLWTAAGGSPCNWEGVILEIFPEPTEKEADASTAAARERLAA